MYSGFKSLRNDFVCDMFECCDLVVNPKHRAIAKDCLRRYAESCGFLLQLKYPVRVAAHQFLSQVRAWVHLTLISWKALFPTWAKFVFERTSYHVVQTMTWKRKLVNIQKVVREFDFRDFTSMDFSTYHSLQSGQDMARIPFHCNLNIFDSHQTLALQQRQFSAQWSRMVGKPLPAPPVSCRIAPVRAKTRFVCSDAAALAEQSFAQLLGHMRNDLESIAVTVEDKDSKILWSSSSVGLISRWTKMLLQQQRWKLVVLEEQHVVEFYRSLLNSCLPRSLLPMNMAFSAKHLPYLYPTVKRKCHRGAPEQGVRSCQKPQHSCLRNVASFWKLPGKKTFKYVGRALRHLLYAHLRGWQTSCLTSCHMDLRSAFSELKARDQQLGCLCVSCKCLALALQMRDKHSKRLRRRLSPVVLRIFFNEQDIHMDKIEPLLSSTQSIILRVMAASFGQC